MGNRGYCRPRTTYKLKERAENLARDLADDREIRGFHDAVTVLVEHIEANE